ncbi:unnamed protein product [Cochlearia groenlandica]
MVKSKPLLELSILVLKRRDESGRRGHRLLPLHQPEDLEDTLTLVPKEMGIPRLLLIIKEKPKPSQTNLRCLTKTLESRPPRLDLTKERSTKPLHLHVKNAGQPSITLHASVVLGFQLRLDSTSSL